MANDVYYICMYIAIAFILLMEHQPEMESGRAMVGLANSKWKMGELFVCGLGCIVLNKKWAEDAIVARLSSRVLLLCLPGLANGSLHAC